MTKIYCTVVSLICGFFPILWNQFPIYLSQKAEEVVEGDSNGDLSPCRDYHDYVVGNLKEATITELWNSEAYRRFRRSLAEDGLMPVCSRCCGLMGY